MEIIVNEHSKKTFKVSVMNDSGKEEEFYMISDIQFWEGSDKHPALK